MRRPRFMTPWRARAVRTGPGSQLRADLSWAALADGRPHRLQGGRHYARDTRGLLREARDAGVAMGKHVRPVRDDLGFDRFCWLQFFDHTIRVGDPCPNGHRRILRRHLLFGECAVCGVRVLLEGVAPTHDASGRLLAPDEQAARVAAGVDPGAGQRSLNSYPLDAFSDIHLGRYGRIPGRERLRGYATSPHGERVMLLVDYLLDANGERVPDPDSEFGVRYSMKVLNMVPWESALDLSALASDDT